MTFPLYSGISHRAELSRPSVALITAGHLVGGIVVAIAAGSAIDALVGRYWFIGGRTLAAVVALAIFFVAARMWGRRISLIAGVGDPQRAGLWTGFLVGIPLIAAGGGLAPLEPVAVRIANGWGLPIHAAAGWAIGRKLEQSS